MARVSQLASCAAIEAVKDAGLDLESENLARIGCVIGSAAGDYANIEEQHLRFQQKGPGSVNPLSIPRIIPNMPACNAAIVLGRGRDDERIGGFIIEWHNDISTMLLGKYEVRSLSTVCDGCVNWSSC